MGAGDSLHAAGSHMIAWKLDRVTLRRGVPKQNVHHRVKQLIAWGLNLGIELGRVRWHSNSFVALELISRDSAGPD